MSKQEFPNIAAIQILAVLGVAALGMAEIDPGIRITGSAAIAAAAVLITYLRLRADHAGIADERKGPNIHDEIAAVLGDGEAAIASSLPIPDTFRLITAKLRSVANFRGAAIWLAGETKGTIVAAESTGDHREIFSARTTELGTGLAGRSWLHSKVETGFESNKRLPSVAVPITRGVDVVGVLQFVFEQSYDLAGIDRTVFQTISASASPIVCASLAYEKNAVNALIDELTGLPNERAFFLVLEQHVAESQRRGADRPIALLAIKVRDFDAIELAYGGGAGDRVLSTVAQRLKEQLRSMDTISRANGDEFLIVLPTATREVAIEIAARIHSVFATRKLEIVPGEMIEIKLNIGAANFGDDGDTPSDLLRSARQFRESRRYLPTLRIIDFPRQLAG